jgi:ribonucleoside-diphosphate reductase alpha chain
MNKSQELLSDIVVYNKYAKYVPELKRRETWEEIVDRYILMMRKRYPEVTKEIADYGKYIYSKQVFPSMRGLQFAGLAIERNESRIYNCAYLPVDSYHSFSETMFLLLGGTGVGYSVQQQHVSQLPTIQKGTKTRKYVIADSIEGWADAVKALMKGYFGKTKTIPDFNFNDIRPKGERLVTSGGKAPGPEPLQRCLMEIKFILDRKKDGDQLTPLECHDIQCHIADAVLAGGIRRAAMIALFSKEDTEMINCKSGAWWELNPQRGRANNSVVLKREEVTRGEFMQLWQRVYDSKSGEPGLYWTNNEEWGTNPCCEIALKPYQFCNLTQVQCGGISTTEEFVQLCQAAAFFGTLQAGFTDFHYLRQV